MQRRYYKCDRVEMKCYAERAVEIIFMGQLKSQSMNTYHEAVDRVTVQQTIF